MLRAGNKQADSPAQKEIKEERPRPGWPHPRAGCSLLPIYCHPTSTSGLLPGPSETLKGTQVARDNLCPWLIMHPFSEPSPLPRCKSCSWGHLIPKKTLAEQTHWQAVLGPESPVRDSPHVSLVARQRRHFSKGWNRPKKKKKRVPFKVFSGVIKVPVSWMPGRSGGGGREGESELNGSFRSREST